MARRRRQGLGWRREFGRHQTFPSSTLFASPLPRSARRPVDRLERVEVNIEPETASCACGTCELAKIREDVSEQLAYPVPRNARGERETAFGGLNPSGQTIRRPLVTKCLRSSRCLVAKTIASCSELNDPKT